MIKKDSVLFRKYIDNLINRTYKILPLYEEKNEGLFKNIQSLILEINGLQYVIEEILDYDYIILLATLESLSDEVLIRDISDGDLDDSHEFFRREVLKCTNLVEKIGFKATGESGDK